MEMNKLKLIKRLFFFLCVSSDLLVLKFRKLDFDDYVIFGRLKKKFQEHWKQCKAFKVSLRPYRSPRKTTMQSVLNKNV